MMSADAVPLIVFIFHARALLAESAAPPPPVMPEPDWFSVRE